MRGFLIFEGSCSDWRILDSLTGVAGFERGGGGGVALMIGGLSCNF
jgi:hypothetical protein